MKHLTDKKSLFITIEGGEGVGKSSFIQLFCQRLSELKISYLKTFEPGGTIVADKLRDLFLNPPHEDPLLPLTEAFMISAGRAQHVGKKITPALAQQQWVISDRYADSFRVYQGFLGGIDLKVLDNLIAISTGSLEPDLTVLLDCDVKIAIERMKQRKRALQTDLTRFDGKRQEFHEKVRSAFLSLAKIYQHRFLVLNADQPLEQLIDLTFQQLKKNFAIL